MKETIYCEEITFVRDIDGVVRVIGESRERGVITLVHTPGHPSLTNDAKKQPKLFN